MVSDKIPDTALVLSTFISSRDIFCKIVVFLFIFVETIQNNPKFSYNVLLRASPQGGSKRAVPKDFHQGHPKGRPKERPDGCPKNQKTLSIKLGNKVFSNWSF